MVCNPVATGNSYNSATGNLPVRGNPSVNTGNLTEMEAMGTLTAEVGTLTAEPEVGTLTADVVGTLSAMRGTLSVMRDVGTLTAEVGTLSVTREVWTLAAMTTLTAEVGVTVEGDTLTASNLQAIFDAFARSFKDTEQLSFIETAY